MRNGGPTLVSKSTECNGHLKQRRRSFKQIIQKWKTKKNTAVSSLVNTKKHQVYSNTRARILTMENIRSTLWSNCKSSRQIWLMPCLWTECWKAKITKQYMLFIGTLTWSNIIAYLQMVLLLARKKAAAVLVFHLLLHHFLLPQSKTIKYMKI